MLTLIQHLVHAKQVGALSLLNLVYSCGLIHIQFLLKDHDKLVLGHRTFKECVEFSSVYDLVDELWNSDGLEDLK